VCSFTLNAGQTVEFALRYLKDDGDSRLTVPVEGQRLLDETKKFWKGWLKSCTYKGRWREQVQRSALVLKLLTHRPSGAMVAAPTCSLPEEIGGSRNWDYRYVWIRDAAFTVYALIRLGFTKEATAFFQWLQQRVHEEDSPIGPLNVMYSLDGRPDLPETTLDHFSGYRDSRPVRIGNGAHDQLQLDIYGELMDSIYLYDKHVTPIPYDLWQKLQKILDWVAANWQQPDDGIWEVRAARENFVYSKLQCWVALDRGTRLARSRSLPLDHQHLTVVRDEIFESIMKHGWDEEKKCFIQSYESKVLDAANLLMPIVFFVAPNDQRMASTLKQTMEQLTSDDLVYRYQLHGDRAVWDGLKGTEGTFSMCTFWLVEALTYAGKLEEAQSIFEKMLTYANHLGLYSEEISATGAALGNFPQAFTHLGLISAAIHLDEKLPR
jgi:GH15 family glucan-1,4-alpha-glucosidase